jgi:NAD(P)-dependent dehydrogenase (short-subunit alcohol dehydrogenase family)
MKYWTCTFWSESIKGVRAGLGPRSNLGRAFMLLDRRLAVVTGAGQGNGAAIVRRLSTERASSQPTSTQRLQSEPLSRFGREAARPGRTSLMYRIGFSVAAFAGHIGKEIGPVSILIDNAGICPRNTIDSPMFARRGRR